MRPTGRLHLGHYSVLENWAKLQNDYDAYFFIADYHALTTNFDKSAEVKQHIQELALDWLASGIDPEKSAIFIQSEVREHAELHLLFSMLTPLSWLERVPTYKDQINQFAKGGKDITTYGFLGYPLLQAADILLYRPLGVPVGEDQVPHIEFCRELARRFNYIYNTDVFPEPQALLAKIKLLPGLDGRKMSKSYDNFITLGAAQDEIMQRVRQMVTDPARIRKDDPGHPEVCNVYTYHKFYNSDEQEEIKCCCEGGTIGCVACKKRLAAKLDEYMAPIRERREYFAERPKLVRDILDDGRERATKTASETLAMVRDAMGLK
jgi:tryptophanyl-tRNA synthetase